MQIACKMYDEFSVVWGLCVVVVSNYSNRLVPVAAATAILGIDPVTLRRWLQSAGLQAIVDPVDRRRRYLSTTDLVQLAQLHRRYISSLGVGGELGQCCAGCSRLVLELADLRRLVNELSSLVSSHG
jgi:hypothetical protein